MRRYLRMLVTRKVDQATVPSAEAMDDDDRFEWPLTDDGEEAQFLADGSVLFHGHTLAITREQATMLYIAYVRRPTAWAANN